MLVRRSLDHRIGDFAEQQDQREQRAGEQAGGAQRRRRPMLLVAHQEEIGRDRQSEGGALDHHEADRPPTRSGCGG